MSHLQVRLDENKCLHSRRLQNPKDPLLFQVSFGYVSSKIILPQFRNTATARTLTIVLYKNNKKNHPTLAHFFAVSKCHLVSLFLEIYSLPMQLQFLGLNINHQWVSFAKKWIKNIFLNSMKLMALSAAYRKPYIQNMYVFISYIPNAITGHK